MIHAKYQEEITREEYNLLQQRLSIYKSSNVGFELVEGTFFNKNENQQYMTVAQKAREDLIQLYLSSAKAQMERYHKKFYSILKQFWHDQHSLSNDKKLTPLIIDLIEQRSKNISESVKCVYKYKFDLLNINSVN